MDLTDIQKDVLYICSFDEMQLDLVIKNVLEENGIDRVDYHTNKKRLPLWVQEVVLTSLREMLVEGLIIIGQHEFSKALGWAFIHFEGSTDEVIAKVKYEWDVLKKNPSLGDVCWIRATEKGIELAKDLGLDKLL